MKTIDLNLVERNKTEIILGDKKIIFEDMPARKAFKAVQMYQDALNVLVGPLSKGKTDDDILRNTDIAKKYQDKMISLCLFIIKPEKKWFDSSYNWLNSKWLYSNLTIDQMTRFVDGIINPIIKKNITTEETNNG